MTPEERARAALDRVLAGAAVCDQDAVEEIASAIREAENEALACAAATLRDRGFNAAAAWVDSLKHPGPSRGGGIPVCPCDRCGHSHSADSDGGPGPCRNDECDCMEWVGPSRGTPR